ncbi:hypothetical protein RF11_15341 [Thelohanellus kitauei]|uniref:Uncharacterized protein n=1 Tax=Thelohanellus kitauei TaxID=669202 RepID=A0A0C2M7G7_THEKT|nr:hypothetical protein RF11_15341 [Thelohanellus kitauei]
MDMRNVFVSENAVRMTIVTDAYEEMTSESLRITSASGTNDSKFWQRLKVSGRQDHLIHVFGYWWEGHREKDVIVGFVKLSYNDCPLETEPKIEVTIQRQKHIECLRQLPIYIAILCGKSFEDQSVDHHSSFKKYEVMNKAVNNKRKSVTLHKMMRDILDEWSRFVMRW